MIERLDDIMQLQRDEMRMIILAQPHTDITRLMVDKNVSVNVVGIKCLTPEEVRQWMDTISPALSDDERSCVLEYSLGIPLLLERFFQHRPITSASAFSQCAVYLQEIVEQSFLGGERRNQDIEVIIAKHTHFSVPHSILSRLADCKNARIKDTPISLLQSKLCPDAEFPVPATLQLYDLYQDWLNTRREEPFFEVFVESMPDAEHFLETLGYCQFPDPAIDQELRRFMFADARKGATFYSREGDSVMREQMNHNSDSLDGWLREHILELARSSGMNASLEREKGWGDREFINIRFPALSSPLYLHKHDHTHRVVMPVAYTVECALQNRNVPYTVRYNDVLFRYDPQTKIYEPLETVKADYWQELYEKQSVAEEDSLDQ